ncbi:MAG: glycosyltransferase family 2 protein [Lachnospiraceae bacterium]|nr:glycosyltransferase family 2 protein [Lachnospiraceae bacterium]
MSKIAVVVCNYNKKDEVCEAVQSVLDSTCTVADLFIVDNGSTDGSVDALEERFGERAIIHRNEENLGGSGGFNLGFRAALETDADYILSLDDDAVLTKDALEKLVAYLDAHKECGIVGPRVYRKAKPEVLQENGIWIDFEEYCSKSPYENLKCLNQLSEGIVPELAEGESAFVNHIGEIIRIPEVTVCDAVPACAMLFRREVMEKVGLFPEENFLYWDDTEFCYLAGLAGWQVVCLGSAVAYHSMGAKKEAETTVPTYYAWRNWLRFYMKYTPEERREEMVQILLTTLYVNLYEAIYQEEEHKIHSLVAAYDDAIHGEMGQVKPDICGPILHSDAKLRRMLTYVDEVQIIVGPYEEAALDLKKKIEGITSRVKVVLDTESNPALAGETYCNELSTTGMPKNHVVITMCDFVFGVLDLSRAVVFADVDGNLLLTAEDCYAILNYAQSLQTFLQTQTELTLDKIKEMHGEL